VRRAVLFSILTGLRFCDIKYLTWQQVLGQSGDYYLQFRQRKTYKPQHVYISNQAYSLLGHHHLKTTQRYTRVVDKAKKEAANRIVLDI